MSDYDRIAEVIRYLDEHQQEQPDLAALANHIGLSPSHFHRLFSSWAGITPKDFLQCLTLEYARESLLAGNAVLDASLDAGLSGPGRLHDLCISLQAATPGEIKSGGEGWTVSAGYTNTPFGSALLAENPHGLCELSFIEPDEMSAAWQSLRDNWPNAELERDDKRAREMGEVIFNPDIRSSMPLKAYVRGTAFQVQVWQALLRIPVGKLISYGHLAEFIGNPKASRAVGTAVGNNPIAYLIPCHRVIRETGAVGGYHWGIARKKAIQAWESGKNDQIPPNH